MTKILIRHGLSEANNAGSPAFASHDAPLMPAGITESRLAGESLRHLYGPDIFALPVAVSSMRRSQQTATEMGFHRQVIYADLDEITHGMPPALLRQTLDAGELPAPAILHAEYLIDHPPEERIWVTHGLVIAGLCRVLGLSHTDWRLIPRFCEIRELPIKD